MREALAAGADPLAQTRWGDTALDWAVNSARPELVARLLAHARGPLQSACHQALNILMMRLYGTWRPSAAEQAALCEIVRMMSAALEPVCGSALSPESYEARGLRSWRERAREQGLAALDRALGEAGCLARRRALLRLLAAE